MLQDSFGRTFQYLRLSVTDVCNFRCVYCLPNGYQKKPGEENPLTVSEIRNLVRGFAELGFWKIRLTGGEPTVRNDIIEIAEAVSSAPGIRKVALSTNGYRLKSLVKPLVRAGVSALNVSVDSLDPDRFKKMTGSERLQDILDGISLSLDSGISEVKVNAVLMRGMNDSDLELFMNWVKAKPISVRFIELMRTGHNIELFDKHHISGGEVQFRLLKAGWKMKMREQGDGPAVEFVHPDYQGRIGLIAPYSERFCDNCNRLRVSSRGALRLCLFGDGDSSLRHLLQHESQREELIETVIAMIGRKEISHHLHEGKYGNTWNLSSIGG